MGPDMKAEIVGEGLKASPPVTVTALAWMKGMTLNEYVAIATLIYIGLQAGYLLWKWYREWKKASG
jgi:hypothetical protein